MIETVSMHGYGVYVWSSVGIVISSLLAMYLHSRRAHNRLVLQLKRRGG